jgi:hypothetical protein
MNETNIYRENRLQPLTLISFPLITIKPKKKHHYCAIVSIVQYCCWLLLYFLAIKFNYVYIESKYKIPNDVTKQLKEEPKKNI